jgi:ribonuclease HI
MKKVIDPYKSDDVLNIFCDASIKKEGKNRYTGCYCAIAVVGDQIIDTICNIVSETTNNNSEIKGVRAGVVLADRYKEKYRIINLFSDSQISIFGMRDRIITWLAQGDNLYGSSNQLISSSSIYIEIMRIIIESKITINFWHQKGHVTQTEESLNNSAIFPTK